MTETRSDPHLATLASIARKTPISCGPQETVESAVRAMRDHRIGSMIVVDEARAPIGILTLRDVTDRVALVPGALAVPIAQVMTAKPVALPGSETAYQAALAMVRRGVRHIVVVEAGRLAGVVSERDLFGMQSTGVRHLSASIRSAEDLDAVEGFGREIHQLARSMQVQGVAVGPLTAFIASLNDLLTERIVELELAAHGLDDADVCWILMGSEGRGEQTLVTDQDNGIIFAVPPGATADTIRERVLPVAQRINRALDRAGFALCKGDIMAGNRQWCLSLDEWRTLFARWIDSGSPEALLHGSIFFDLRPLHGAVGLAHELRAWLLEHAAKNRRFLHQLAANALRSRPPLGVLRDFALADDGRVDLKLNGVTPFVDAGRLFSLAHGIDETHTERRLRAAASPMKIGGRELEAWITALHCLQGHRLRVQAEALATGAEAGNRLAPADLNDFDRQVLKLAFQQARSLQARVTLDFG